MGLVISDANIFIDLWYMELIEEFFLLDVKIHTTSEVIKELDSELVAILHKQKIPIIPITDSLNVESEKLSFSASFSVADMTLLTIAYTEQFTLLSGEKLMVKWCRKHGVDVHGIVYVIDQFVQQKICSAAIAIAGLEKLMDYNSWLPQSICEAYIAEWGKMK